MLNETFTGVCDVSCRALVENSDNVGHEAMERAAIEAFREMYRVVKPGETVLVTIKARTKEIELTTSREFRYVIHVETPVKKSPLNELAKEIHENAKAHGWWDEERNFGEIIALCHSELSEALEEYRDGKPMEYHECRRTEEVKGCKSICHSGVNQHCDGKEDVCGYVVKKPEGIAVEMADCIIRILDWCGREGIDIDAVMREKMAYNATRPYRHGGKVI